MFANTDAGHSLILWGQKSLIGYAVNGSSTMHKFVIVVDAVCCVYVQVVRTGLRSHFLPLSSIQTEAVLFLSGPNVPHSLSQEEIQFAFR